MAKRGTLDHPKNFHLAQELGCATWASLGLLEAFWHWVSRYHPQGFVTDQEMRAAAYAIRFDGDLVAPLLATGFLDEAEGGYAVHDWADHADDTTKKVLQRKGWSMYGAQSENVETVSRQNPPKDGQKIDQPKPKPKPISKNPLPPTSEFTEAFQQLRGEYPKRSGSYAWVRAERALQKALTRSSLEEILKGLVRYRNWLAATGKLGTEFVAQPASWLNANGWEEDYHPPATGTGPPLPNQGYRPIHEVLDEIEAQHA